MSNCDFGSPCTCRDCRTKTENIKCPICGFITIVDIEMSWRNEIDRKTGKVYYSFYIPENASKINLYCYKCDALVGQLYYSEVNKRACDDKLKRDIAIDAGKMCNKCNAVEGDFQWPFNNIMIKSYNGQKLCPKCKSATLKENTPDPTNENERFQWDEKVMKWISNEIRLICKSCNNYFWTIDKTGTVCCKCLFRQEAQKCDIKSENRISIEQLKEETGIDFINISEIKRYGKTYEDLENIGESNTHALMRQYAENYFKELGYFIYPNGIGVKGCYTLADFLAYRKGKIIFIECLTEKATTFPTIQKKMGLAKFGELVFVVLKDASKINEILSRSEDISYAIIDILIYDYGDYNNPRRIITQSIAPRFAFDICRNEKIEASISVETKRNTAEITFSFTSPIISESLREKERISFYGNCSDIKNTNISERLLNHFLHQEFMFYRKQNTKCNIKGRKIKKLVFIKNNKQINFLSITQKYKNSIITIRNSQLLSHLIKYINHLGISLTFNEIEVSNCINTLHFNNIEEITE